MVGVNLTKKNLFYRSLYFSNFYFFFFLTKYFFVKTTFNNNFDSVGNYVIVCYLFFILYSINLDLFSIQIYSFFILNFAAAESAIGLSILIIFYRLKVEFQ